MGTRTAHAIARGPFRADQIREGDRYELSNGHAIECMPAGREHSRSNLTGGAAIESDPDVEWAGVDAGFSPEPGTLRAPDVAVGPDGSESGWITEAPPLAVEYASVGQNEEELEEKIADLFAAGTRLIWVVRLIGPRRVEVHEPGQPVRTLTPGEELHAPGILRNPVPVLALFDREAAHEVTLRNLLQRRGYESLEAVAAEGEAHGRAEGEALGRAEAILELLADRGIAVSDPIRDRIRACRDLNLLRRWLKRAVAAADAAEVVAED